MTVTHYTRSTGEQIVIADMPLRYATSALHKLQRDREDDSRDAEINALQAHVTKLSEEYLEQQAAGGDTQPGAAAFGDLEAVTL